MEQVRGVRWCVVAGMLAATLMIGCGVSQEKLDEARGRIDALAEQGAPDSALGTAKVLVAEVEGAMKAMNGAEASQKAKALSEELTRLEAWFQQALESTKPELKAARAAVDSQKAELTGLHLRAADSMLTRVDSLEDAGRILQARATLAKVEAMLPALHESQKKATKLKGRVVGIWREVARPDAAGATSVEIRTYTFGKDGSLKTSEKKKGKSNVGLKEDWAFESWGTWDMKGDTVHMHIEREKCLRQIYETLVKKNGRERWERNAGPAYDSTITDGRKDQWIAYTDLDESFNKIR